jgi:chromosome partitioning protein
MKTIVLASQKGGSAKTTLSAHLAVAADLAGDGPTVLLDCDPQGSLAAWWNARESVFPALAPTTIAALPDTLTGLAKAGYKYAVIDTPPAITASIRAVLAVADIVIIPARPSPHDLRAIGQTVDLVHAADRPFFFAVTQAKAHAHITIQTVVALSAHGAVADAIMHDRVDYASSMTDGRTVIETDPQGRSAVEIVRLWLFTKARLNESTKGRKR